MSANTPSKQEFEHIKMNSMCRWSWSTVKKCNFGSVWNEAQASAIQSSKASSGQGLKAGNVLQWRANVVDRVIKTNMVSVQYGYKNSAHSKHVLKKSLMPIPNDEDKNEYFWGQFSIGSDFEQLLHEVYKISSMGSVAHEK